MNTFTEQRVIEIRTVPGTPYVVLHNDANFADKAVAAKSIELETAIADLPEVKALGENDVVYDLGCLFLDTAVIFGKRGAQVFAFEAQLDAYLCAHANALHHPNIIAIWGAVGNGERVVNNQDQIDGNLGTRTTTPNPAGEKSIRIDDLSLPPPTFIKADVEAAELFVLRGAEKTIRTFKPTILLEIYGSLLARINLKPQDIYDFLESVDYGWEVVIGSDQEDRYDIMCKPKG